MIYGILAALIAIAGGQARYRQGHKKGVRDALWALESAIPGAASVGVIILASARTPLGSTHTIDGSGVSGHRGCFTITHPAGCDTDKCAITKALRPYGELAHVTESQP